MIVSGYPVYNTYPFAGMLVHFSTMSWAVLSLFLGLLIFLHYSGRPTIFNYCRFKVQSQGFFIMLIFFSCSLIMHLINGFLMLNSLMHFFSKHKMPATASAIHRATEMHYIGGVQHHILGSAVLLLCFMVTIISLAVLDERDSTINKISVEMPFTIFLLCMMIMVHTTNLAVMYGCFVCLFADALFFTPMLKYSWPRNDYKIILLVSLVASSWAVEIAFYDLYNHHQTLDYILLRERFPSINDSVLLCVYVFGGLGVVLPLFPLQRWWFTLHDKMPIGFSIFFSNFFVMPSLYMYYYVILIFALPGMSYAFGLVVLLSFCVVGMRLHDVITMKQFVAMITTQDMTIFLMYFLLSADLNLHLTVYFLLSHVMLSALMFYVAELIQIRANVSTLSELRGAGWLYPQLTVTMGWMWFFYVGVPFTIKFLLGAYVVTLAVVHYSFGFGVIMFIMLLSNSMMFSRACWNMLFGNPSQELRKTPLNELNEFELIMLFVLIILVSTMTSLFWMFGAPPNVL